LTALSFFVIQSDVPFVRAFTAWVVIAHQGPRWDIYFS
jgi:hypothetical protein